MRVFIIGAGPGGYETALAARKHGFEVILAESGQVGGTCLNAGCIPTKAYCRTAEILEEVRHSSAFGITAGEPVLDFGSLRKRKDDIVSGLRSGIESMLGNAGVRLVRGRAVFRDSGTVEVEGEKFPADYIIVATGSAPAIPDFPGNDLPGVVDSTALLDSAELPGRLCIIGGGVIGLEFASVFRSFGSEVTVVEFCKEILPAFDQDIARRLRQSLSKRGVVFSLQSMVQSVEPCVGGGLKTSWIRKSVQESCEADLVLVATGRRPCCEGLHPEAAGIALSDKGAIMTDDRMRTSVPHIYAIGDVNGRQLLAHAASAQGKVALDSILSEISDREKENSRVAEDALSVMPSAVFTMPEVASVGLSEESCKEKGISFRVLKSFFRSNGKAVCMGETDGLCKILVSSEDNKILGCHVLGPHAADLVQEVSVLMAAGVSAETLRRAVHIHPTLGEVLQSGF